MTTPKPFTGDPKSHDPAKFADGMTGTCLCGSISVTVNDSELFTKKRGHLCHCSNCRKVSGSYVAANFAIETTCVEVKDTNGTLKKYEDRDTGSGNPVIRCFCGNCGSPVMSLPSLTPNMTILKMGMFPRIPEPESEAFAAHRHPWQGKHDGVVLFETARNGKKLEE